MRAITHTIKFAALPTHKNTNDEQYALSLVAMAMLEEALKSICQMKNIKQGIRHAFDTIEWITVVECAFEGIDIEPEAIWQYACDLMDWTVEQVIHHDFDYLLDPVTVVETYLYPGRLYGKIVLFIKDYIDVEEKKQCHNPQFLLTGTG